MFASQSKSFLPNHLLRGKSTACIVLCALLFSCGFGRLQSSFGTCQCVISLTVLDFLFYSIYPLCGIVFSASCCNAGSVRVVFKLFCFEFRYRFGVGFSTKCGAEFGADVATNSAPNKRIQVAILFNSIFAKTGSYFG